MRSPRASGRVGCTLPISSFVSTVIEARCAASPAARNSGRTDDRVRRLGVDERVVEEAERELLAQQASCRGIQPLLGDLAVAHQLDQQLGARLAAELVGTGIEHLLHALVAG